jgi:hypothetical protein
MGVADNFPTGGGSAQDSGRTARSAGGLKHWTSSRARGERESRLAGSRRPARQLGPRRLDAIEKERSVMKNLARILMFVVAVAVPLALRADTPGPHPHYLHALSNLRAARANVERRGGDLKMRWDEHKAVAAIDLAIHDIKEAAIDDGKDINDHPPVDANLAMPGRLHHALDLLHEAHDEVTKYESNEFAHGLQARVIKHVNAAIHEVEKGLSASQ